MAAFRWLLTSPLGGTISWPLNPREGALPSFDKTLTIRTTTGGAPVIFEGAQPPQMMQITGSILEESHYDFFRNWHAQGYAVVITDDLGNNFTGYLKSFKPKRKIRHSHPWAADYDCEILVWGA